ncbi:CD109 antigen isoform X1 [Alosa sapidissima]|uniref:CD109 antigen isoform X1 n=1 Tax=Alosa sapidissima TaxID=34773 RepID=UPI001C085E18|nr:CD109 antigen isoform X1 [Alosa sapidissima]XP_041951101.1 CD109 antigen isoform X1 [Alosa sapidissima]
MEWLQVFGLFGFFVCFSGAQTTQSPSSSPSYLITGPRVLRYGIPTSLSVTVLRDSPVRVVSEIINLNMSISKTETIIPGGSTGLQELPAVPESDMSYWHPYELVIKGYDGGSVVFTNSTYLRFIPRSSSTFIQTDKPNYKPGQVVKIRAVSIHPDGQPFESQVDMVIKDPRGNMIRQWLSVDSVLGIISKEFQLSQNPPLGMWTIMTTVNEATKEKHFHVNHYVLPNFEIKVEVPEVMLQHEPFSGTVHAQYMYGKPVYGHLNITYTHFFHGIDVDYHKEKEIDGTAEFTFYMPDYTESKRSADYMYQYYEGYGGDEYVNITVSVTDYTTGLTYHRNVVVTLVKCQYKLAFHGYPNIIKPSLNFSAQVKVSTYDRSPLSMEDQGKMLRLSISQQKRSPWSWRQEDLDILVPRMHNMSMDYPGPSEEIPVIEMSIPVPADGIVPFHVRLSDKVATLNIEAWFEDAHKGLQLYNTYSSPSQSYIQLHRHGDPKIGHLLQLTVLSSFPLNEFHYLVIGRGQLLSAGTESSSSFSLTPDESWAPEACVLVYCIRPDGEIINDVLRVPVHQVLRNTVSLSWSRDRVEPGEEVRLGVSVSEPGSVVGILVVDKATHQPGDDNDITQDKVLEELAQYNMGGGSTDVKKMGDPYSVFTGSNLMVLTDANLDRRTDWRPEFPGEIVMYNEEMDVPMNDDVVVRQNFPETWLWLDADLGGSTGKKFSVTVPDSITSWVATAFVMSETLGLGIVNSPAELTVFQDFFLALNLPAYIIRGELLVLEVNLFNYLDEDLEVMVIVAESASFEFVFPDTDGVSMASTRTVSVWSQNGTSVLFPIRPTVLGEMPISVKAISSYNSDAVHKTVLVKPEGIEQSFTQTLFLDLPPTQSTISREISFTFPPDVVLGSESARVTAVGDILGPSITGLESLIQMPYGCGEQNMINFAPNIYILQYLANTGQDDSKTRERAISFMMQGYERELSYQRMDGSFSAFGDSDQSGSTWLSAFVLRCFLQARSFIPIDPRVLDRTAMWLTAQQDPSGQFSETGRVIHTELQGGLDGPVSLTAYALMALLEDDTYKNMYTSQVSMAQSFLESRVSHGVSSDYSLCLVTYALSLTNSGSARAALDELMERAVETDGVPMWSKPDAGLAESWQPRSSDIEMAAYVLLSLRRLGLLVEGIPLMKWLSQQRNHLGGYGSTQDTIIALQALAEYAVFSGSELIDLNVEVQTDSLNTVATFNIDGTNYGLYQTQEIEAETDIQLQVTAEGKGFALFQMTVFYNVESAGFSRRRRGADMHEAFSLYIDTFDMGTKYVHLLICVSLYEGLGLNRTGMAILEVGLLSGFVLAQDSLQTDHLVRKVETQPGKVILYLDSISTEELCINFPILLEHKVAKVQDAVVVVYDYYEPRRKTVRMYNSWMRTDMSACMFCGGDCSECGGSHNDYDDYYVSASPSMHCLRDVHLLSVALLLLSRVW